MGFWDSLFRSTPVNNAAGNNIAYPGVRSSREAADTPDFYEEYASELYADTDRNADYSYSENGLSLKEASNIYRLTYDGILAKDGARDVYAVIDQDGKGSWQNVKYYPMHKTEGQAFEVLFPAKGLGSINIAFKDGADHWDNNSGKNYTYVNNEGG